jgi:hypothetical protein
VNLDGFDRLRLVGDEDCGVGLECNDHWDGGRPLAYLGNVYPDPLVVNVADVPALLAEARRHLDEHHPEVTP